MYMNFKIIDNLEGMYMQVVNSDRKNKMFYGFIDCIVYQDNIFFYVKLD